MQRNDVKQIQSSYFDSAWTKIDFQIKEKAALYWKKHFSNQQVKAENREIITKAKKAGLQILTKNFAALNEKFMKGYLARKRYKQKIAAIKFIQSHFRTTWTRKLFVHLRN